jgi:hypothetical protein
MNRTALIVLVVLTALAVALVLIVGRGNGEGGKRRGRFVAPPASSASPGSAPTDAAAIQDWIRSMNAGEYERAANWFAKNAIVEQVRETRMRTHQDVVNFLRGLPCRADVTRIVDEGATDLASFRLRAGPGGPCKGRARVRFTIAHGKFTEWRQLLEPAVPRPPGDTA